VWNINKKRHSTNIAVEVWNFKPNSIMEMLQPNTALLVRELNEEAELVYWQMKSKKTGEPGQKRNKKKKKVKQHEKIKRMIEDYVKSSDLYKSLQALCYINRCQ
jgi:hypothetical protein